MATSKLTTSMKPPDLTKFAAWGNQAGEAYKQGFYPQTSWFNNGIVYASPYNAAFNDVVNPKNPNQRGNIAFIGYPNKTFDIVIRDKQGNLLHTVNQGVSPEFVQNYITNANSTVAQRNMRILKNTPAIQVASK